MSDAFITAVIGTIGAIIITIVGLYSSKKFKIGQAQEKLVETLQSLVEAQDKKIKELTSALEEATKRIQALEKEVDTLKSLTIVQALEIKGNQEQLDTLMLKPPRRGRASNE